MMININDMKISIRIFLIGTTFALASTTMAQQAPKKQDSLGRAAKVGSRLEAPRDAVGRKKFERDHYRRSLGVDSVKAEQLQKVHSDYKSGVGRVMADTSLNDAGKRAAIDRLIQLKNSQLEKLLTPAQQSKVIPTTERKRTDTKGQ